MFDKVSQVPPPPHDGIVPRQHLLGISLEDYFQVGAFRELIDRRHWGRFESRLERATDATLDLLESCGAHATFFTLGWVAEHLPELVRRVVERGHEVANSGFSHRGVKELGEGALRDDLLRSHEAITRATGRASLGTRIPDWLRERDLWALDVIAGLGYAYDASFRPLGTDCSAHPGHRFPFDHVHRGRLVREFPVPTLRVGPVLVPIGGGNWIRQLPEWLVIRAIEHWQQTRGVPFALYFQSWELDPAQPRISAATWLTRVRHYRNIDQAERLLRRILAGHSFVGYAAHLGIDVAEWTRPTLSLVDPPPVRLVEESVAAAHRVPVTVVVPCFNEADTLPYLQNTLRSVTRELSARYRVSFIFVDDGSRDGTWEVLHSLVGHRDDCQLLRHASNQGIAHAILTGIAASRDEFVCSIDADCTYDPHQLASLLPPLVAGADLVTASPYHPAGRVRHVPRWRLFLSRTLSAMYSRRLRASLHTYTSCFRAYRRSRFVGITLTNPGFLGIAEMLVRALQTGARVSEVPATLEVRLIGHSKLKVMRVIAGHLHLLWSMRRWPTAPLGAPRLPVEVSP